MSVVLAIHDSDAVEVPRYILYMIMTEPPVLLGTAQVRMALPFVPDRLNLAGAPGWFDDWETMIVAMVVLLIAPRLSVTVRLTV